MTEVLNLGLFYLDKAVTNLGYQRREAEKAAGEVSETVKSRVRDAMTLHGSRFFLRLGGLSGAVAVSMAAYGAHGNTCLFFLIQVQGGLGFLGVM